MDRWKKNLPVRTENFNLRLTSHGRPIEDDGSLIEIDIQSSIDFSDREAKRPGGVTFERYLTKALPRLPKKCEKSFEVCQLEESTFEKPFREGKKPSQKVYSKLPSNNSHTDKNEKVPSDKVGKENQSLDAETERKFKEYIKKHLIENFVSKNDPSMKSMFQSICNEAENKNQLHFHHHEHHEHHHHHYYFDDGSMNVAEPHCNEDTPGSEVVNNREKFHAEKRTKEKPMNTYYFNCPTKSTGTYTKVDAVLAGIRNAAKNYEPPKFEKSLKSSAANSRLKLSNSIETLYCKKSDFVATHFYNDRELKKSDSNELTASESEKEKLLLDVSYADDSFGGNFKTVSRGSADKLQTILPNTPKKIQVNSLIQETNQNWGASVKAELNNIRKELQLLEERHAMKRLKKQTEMHKISVYSNKTFIIGSEKLFLKKKRQKENQLEKNEEPQVTVGYCIVNPESTSKEKKDYLKKKIAPRQEHFHSNGAYLISNKVN